MRDKKHRERDIQATVWQGRVMPPWPRSVAGFIAVTCSAACAFSRSAPARPSPTGSRVILGRLVVDGAPASDWVSGGTYSGADLVIDDHLTVRDGRPVLEASSMEAPGVPFTSVGAQGGPIRFGAAEAPVYLLGLRVSRAVIVIGTSTVFPILARIPAETPGGMGSCDYIGTIHLRREGDTSRAAVVDDYESDARALARGRCTPRKNLAQTVDIVNGEAVPVVVSARVPAKARTSPR
jgi:hypothetical protein